MFTRKFRARRYAKLLTQTPLSINDSPTIAGNLASLWKHFHVEDFAELDLAVRGSLELTVWRAPLPELVTAFHVHNQLIAGERDNTLELNLRQQNEQQTLLLDFFLADAQAHPIDTPFYLRRLQGLLQQHQFLVSQQSGYFYQRVSESYYHDVVELTDALITAVNR